MTQKQIDTLKELGFKKNVTIYTRLFRTKVLDFVIVSVDSKHIEIVVKTPVIKTPFTLTKLREIVGKLEKL